MSSFGGLDGFGMGDLGFDPDALGGVLDDIKNEAGGLMDAASAAMDAVQQLQGLASLSDLASVGNPIKPLADQAASIGKVGDALKGIADGLKALTG